MSIIEIRGLTKYYGKNRGIIDVNMDVQEGEIFGFIGPNGAGKSTTIRILLDFIKAKSGSAKIFGRDCFTEGREIKKDIGYLPSEVNYYDDMKVKELLLYSAGFYQKDCGERIGEISAALELDLNKIIDQLSFGNKKKVAIVQALLHNPRLLILDEPTGGLDPLMQNRFFEILREENRKGVTVFFSSHILSEVQKLCDRVAIIKEGRILKTERIEDLISSRYKRLRIEFADNGPIPEPDLEGVGDLTVKGRYMEFLFAGRMDDIIRKLSEYHVENLWIEEPSLEEIFMHYYETGAN